MIEPRWLPIALASVGLLALFAAGLALVRRRLSESRRSELARAIAGAGAPDQALDDLWSRVGSAFVWSLRRFEQLDAILTSAVGSLVVVGWAASLALRAGHTGRVRTYVALALVGLVAFAVALEWAAAQ